MLSSTSIEGLVAAVAKTITSGVPGTSVCVVGKDGRPIFQHAAGKRGVDSHEAMTPENVFWVASCTKMITGIACMQLVEQGKMELDSVEFVEKLAPELREVKVLTTTGELVDKTRGITVRMLLTHTAGFGYAFFNNKLRKYNYPIGYDEFSGNMYDMLQPLVNQPGERWEYGINVDWAGFLLERITGMSLNDYMHEHIFAPLALSSTSLFPTEAMKNKFAFMHQKQSDGTYIGQEPLLRAPLIAKTQHDKKHVVNSGGAGAFTTPEEYCQILAVLLNEGKSPITGAQILKAETVSEMFTNQIPHLPDYGRVPIDDSKPLLTNFVPQLYPQDGDPAQGWGLTFMLTIDPTNSGRAKAAGHWSGISNCYWWMDREKGVAGLVCSQILPYGDADVVGLWVDVETLVNKGLEV